MLSLRMWRRVSLWRVAESVLAAFGVIWLAFEPLGLFFPNKFDSGWTGYFGLLALSIVAGLIRSAPRSKVRHKISGTDVDVVVAVGDLLEQRGNVVIGSNDVFDTQLGRIISEKSVQGQFQEKIYSGDMKALERDLASALAGIPSEKDPTKTTGKSERYPIGTVAMLPRSGARYFLLAYARMSSQLHAESDLQRLWYALDRCWEEIHVYGQVEPVHVAIMGSKFSRIPVSRMVLIQLIAASFVARSRMSKFTPMLVIHVPESDIDDVDLDALESAISCLTRH